MNLLAIYTVVHVIISVVAILAGFAVLYGLFTSKPLNAWNAFFLATMAATDITGFFFPVKHFMPSHGVGIISMLILALAVYARYGRGLAGAWGKVYSVGAVLALYLDIFVAIVQAFLKIPSLQALAPTQSEPPFKLTQLVVLVIFVALAVLSVIKFRIPVRTA